MNYFKINERKKQNWNYARNAYLFALFFLLVLFNSGIWIMPNIQLQYEVSQSLSSLPFTNINQHYLYFNYFEPLIFGFVGGDSLKGYLLFSLLVSFIFLFLLFYNFVSINEKELLKYPIKIFVLAVFPVTMIPLYWVGMDGMTLLLMLIIMIYFESKWAYLISIFLAWQHFEQGILSLTLLATSMFLYWGVHRETVVLLHFKKILFLILFLLIGKFFLVLWFYYMDISLVGGRTNYFENNIMQFLAEWKNNWLLILYSLLGVGWIIVFKYFKETWPVILSALIIFFFTAAVGDQTRVGVIVLFPTVMYWVFLNKKLWVRVSNKFAIFTIILYIFLPVVVIWGSLQSSVFDDDIALLLDFLNNHSYIDFHPLSPFVIH